MLLPWILAPVRETSADIPLFLCLTVPGADHVSLEIRETSPQLGRQEAGSCAPIMSSSDIAPLPDASEAPFRFCFATVKLS